MRTEVSRPPLLGRVAFLVATLGLVHAAALDFDAALARDPKPKRAEPQATAPKQKASTLPSQVVEMRDAILAAAAAGDINELRVPLDWNELPPDTGAAAGTDIIAHWRTVSVDGQGREILAALANVLSVAPAITVGGRDIENNRLFVWPHHAEKPLAGLTPAEEVELYRIVPPPEAKTMKDQGRYTGWRLVIGADGTWHSFKRQP